MRPSSLIFTFQTPTFILDHAGSDDDVKKGIKSYQPEYVNQKITNNNIFSFKISYFIHINF